MSKEDLSCIVDKSLDLFLDKEWKFDLLVLIYVIIFTIGVMMLILTPIKAIIN